MKENDIRTEDVSEEQAVEKTEEQAAEAAEKKQNVRRRGRKRAEKAWCED